MARKLLLSLVLLSGCSKGPEADVQYIGQARSAAAEWALINQKAAQGQLNRTYVASMHHWLRDDIQTSLDSLTERKAPYAAEMAALLREPDDAAPDQLRAHADRLKGIEDQIESA
jgi:Tfp pilus assembly protein PilP